MLALVAIGVRGLAPAGYMLVASPDRFVTVTLCSAHGGRVVTIDRSTGDIVSEAPERQEQGDGKNSAPCVCAAALHLASPVIAPRLIALGTSALLAPLAAYQAAPGRGLAAPPPWSTGPPQQV